MLNINFDTVAFAYVPLEITLNRDDDFLKIRETLTRIGVASHKERKLFQSCHILQKQGRLYIVHFKELFALSGKSTDLIDNDLERRNTIAKLLEDWNLLKIVDRVHLNNLAPMGQIKVLTYRDKQDWELIAKYTMNTDLMQKQKEAA